jgi:hypothetical protein
MNLDMWEGRQFLGTIFVRWRKKHLDCQFFCFCIVLTAAKKKLLVGYWRIGSTKDSQGHY